jgi:rSAM/selenodomain-associated transferase 1
MSTVVVLAKAPVPGRVKTRLCPPCSPVEAAGLAEAALRDTLDAVRRARVDRRVVVLDGSVGDWLPDGFTVVAQRGTGLGSRLAGAFTAVGAPALLVGMDTPQLTPGVLEAAWATLEDPSCDAVLGPALDGGYWAIGLKHRTVGAFTGVPMSTPRTCARQHERLCRLGLRVVTLGAQRDVDDVRDAFEVARQAPTTRFARSLDALVGAAAR